MKRRLLAWILVIAMSISCVPLQVFAQEDSGEPEPVLMEATVETTQATEETAEATEEITEATEEPLLLEETEAAEPTEEVLLLEEETRPEEEKAESTSEGFVLPMEIPDDFVAPFASTYDDSEIPSEGYPSSYDSRNYGYITSVKNQGKYGLCWAFSAMATSESSLVSSGIASRSVDLSEWHLAHYYRGSAYDPLGNTAGDSTQREDFLMKGSNNAFTTFALANWAGAALESKYGYGSSMSGNSASAAMDDAYHLKNAYWINAQDTDNIKRYIMSNGAVGLSYYHDDANFNSTYDSYYNSTVTKTNHAVTVVGWNDNFSASKFKKSPGSNGAWLVKNSWGTSWGDGGYFWLSYKDASINTSDGKAFVFQMEPASKYDFNYQYDGSIGTMTRYVSRDCSIANVFKASGATSGKDEEIRAVGMGIASADVNYSIQIYRNPTSASVPTSGTAMLSTPQTGTTHTAGFYTVELNEPVRVKKGDTFAVVITLANPNNYYVDFFVDATYQNGDWISFTSSTKAGQSFSQSYNGSWTDLHNSGYAARVKAYTKMVTAADEPKPLTGLSFGQTAVDMKVGNTFSQTPTKQPSDAQVGSYTWSSSNTAVATVNSSGTVTAVKAGTATITVSTTTTSGTFSASYRVTVTDGVLSSGSCGPSLTYTLTSDGVLTITGSGIMGDDYWGPYDYEWPWDSYRSQIKTVKLPSGLTTIGDHAFEGCSALTSITIPSSVTRIGDRAFCHCTGLTAVTIPNQVTWIDQYAFAGCSGLTSLTLGSGVRSIYGFAFNSCTALTSVTLPDSVTYLGNRVFSNCQGLRSVTISRGLTSIAEETFLNCTALPTVSIPDSVTTLKQGAFEGCSSLDNITIPSSVTTIEKYVFSCCSSLSSITIPEGVTSIESHAFWKCTSLTTVSIPNSVNTIGESAFGSCSSLCSVSIPNSVTSIGEGAFSFCNKLESVSIPDGVTAIGDRTFSYCDKLASITIPKSVTSIGTSAFYSTGLTSVVIPKGVATIKNGAFGWCTKLKEITFRHGPADTLAIEDGAFLQSLYDGVGDTQVSVPDKENLHAAISGYNWAGSYRTVTYVSTDRILNTITASDITLTADSTKAQTVSLNATSLGGAALSYRSNNASVTVSDTGVVTVAKGFSGTATITITAAATTEYLETTKDITVTVKPAPVSNTITASNIDLTGDDSKDQTVSINASALGGAALSYRSNNASVTVSDAGVVTVAKGFIGTATITITAAATTEYLETTKVVTVTVNPAPVVNADAEIVVDSVKALAGQEITVPVRITKNPGIAGFGLTVGFDSSVLTLNSITPGSVISGTGMFGVAANGVSTTWYAGDNVTDAGVLMELNFTVSETAAEGKTTVSLSFNDNDDSNLSDVYGTVLSASFTAGQIDVSQGVLGDVSGDGKIAINDVVMLNSSLLGKVTLSERARKLGDVTGDGKIAINDVVRLNSYLLKKVTDLRPSATAADTASSLISDSAAQTASVTATIGVGSVRGTAGQTLTVPVSISNNPGIGAFFLTVDYDTEAMTLDAIEAGELLRGVGMFSTNGGLVSWYNSENLTLNGELMLLRFTLKDTIQAGTHPVTLSLVDGEECNLSDFQGIAVPGTFTAGAIVVPGPNTIEAENITVTGSNEQSITIPLNATALGGAVLSYRSGNASIKISANGVVTIPKGFSGTVKITITAAATTEYLETTKDITVTVKPAPVPNTITASNIDLTGDNSKDQTVSINASALGGAALSYYSDNASIKVSADGVITIPKGFLGTAKITITAAAVEGYLETTKEIIVSVTMRNTITAQDITVIGSNEQSITVPLNATTLGGAVLSYRSGNASIKVSANGVVTIPKGFSGTVKITITAAATTEYLETTKDITLTVKPAPVPNTITASNIDLTGDDSKDQTVSINASALGGAALSYRSDNASIKVSADGVITIPKGFLGTAKITITAAAVEGYLETTKEIIVSVTMRNTITAQDITVIGSNEQSITVPLNATALGGAVLSYRSGNASIKISADGVVTIPKGFSGTVKITITAAATTEYLETTKDITVTVKPAPVPNTITASNISLSLDETNAQTVSLNATALGGAKLIYVSDSEDVTVSDTGVVTVPAGFLGTAKITITAAAVEGYLETTKVITVSVTAHNTIDAEDLTVTGSIVDAITVPLNATARDGAKLRYSSSTAYVTISDDGMATISKGFDGIVKITITAGATEKYLETTKIITLTVKPGPIYNTITAPNVTLTVNEEEQQTVSLNAVALGGAALSYRSDSEDVTVSNTGVVTIPAGFLGTAKITITAAAVEGYLDTAKTVLVTVNPLVTDPDVKFLVDDVTVLGGDSITVPVYLTRNRGIGWIDLNVSYDPTVLTLDKISAGQAIENLGVFRDTGNGSFVWTYSNDITTIGQLALLHFTVSENAPIGSTKVAISPSRVSTWIGREKTFTSTPGVVNVVVNDYKLYTVTYDANGGKNAPEAEHRHELWISDQVPTRKYYKFLGWAETPDAVAPQYEAGGMYHVLDGDITLYAVWEHVESAIMVEKPRIGLTSGQSTTLNAYACPDDTVKVLFALEDPKEDSKYVTLKGNVLTAKTVKERTWVTIIATTENNSAPPAEIEVFIYPKTTKVEIVSDDYDGVLNNKTLSVNIDEGYIVLDANNYPEDAQYGFTWKSSNPSIAEVDGGFVTLHKAGKVTITATAADGSKKSGKVTLNIVQAPASMEILNAPETLQGGQKVTLKTDVGQNVKGIDRNITWALDEDSAAFASIKNGVLTTKAVFEPVPIRVTAYAAANPEVCAEAEITLLPTATAAQIWYQGSLTNKTTVLYLRSGETLKLEGRSYPENAYGTGTWKVKGDSATVTNDGTVRGGIKSGISTITYTFAGKSTSIMVQTVNKPVTEIRLYNEFVDSGKSITLNAYVNSDASVETVIWSLADPADSAYCTLTSNGKFTAKTVYLETYVDVIATAVDGSGLTNTTTVKIYPKSYNFLTVLDADGNPLNNRTIPLEPKKESMEVHAKFWFSSTGNRSDIIWKSSNPSVASVDADGKITAHKAGTAKITASLSWDKRVGSFTIKVGTPVNDIQVGVKNDLPAVLRSGSSLTMTALTNPDAANKKVTWSVECPKNDPKCATISSSGVLKAAAGLTSKTTVWVTATAADGSGTSSMAFPVVICPAATGVNISIGDRVVNGLTIVTSKDKTELTAKVFPNAAYPSVTWKSSSAKIATVNERGEVTFLNAGTVTITATAADGSKKAASFKLTYAPGK